MIEHRVLNLRHNTSSSLYGGEALLFFVSYLLADLVLQ